MKKLKNPTSQEISYNKDSKRKDPIDQWCALSRELNFQKKLSLLLGLFCLILTFFILILFFRPPIVTLIHKDQMLMLQSQRASVPIGEQQIKALLKRFIIERYEWNLLNPKDISARVSPFVTKGLREKIKVFLENIKSKKLKGKSVSQEIGKIRFHIQDDKVYAIFYRILIIENVPLIVPTKLSFSLTQGSQTIANPEGVYINKISEEVY